MELELDWEVVQRHPSDQVRLSTNWDAHWRNLAAQSMDIVEQGKVADYLEYLLNYKIRIVNNGLEVFCFY